MKKIFIAALFFVLIIPVNAQSKKELKRQKAEEEYAALKELINSKNFIFEADWTTTQKGNRINLTTNPNFLKIEGDQVTADMPYFGVAHTAIGMGSGEAGIKFEGNPKDYKVEFNDKKLKAIIKFDATNKSENFDVILSVYKSGSASLNITSSKRNSITYDGRITEIK
jgi:hypothetical protein